MKSTRRRPNEGRHSSHRVVFTPLDESCAKKLCDAIVLDAMRNVALTELPSFVRGPIIRELKALKAFSFDWFLTCGPALARELSSALASNSEEQLSSTFLTLFPTFSYFLRSMFVFGRCIFSPSGAPHGFESCEVKHGLSDQDVVERNRRDFACILLQVREVLGLYARLTRASNEDTHASALREAVARLTATPQIELPNSFIFVGEQLLGQFDLRYLQADGEDCCWLPKHGPGACAEFQRWNPRGSVGFRTAWKHAWKESIRWIEDPMRFWVRGDWFRPLFPPPEYPGYLPYDPSLTGESASVLSAVPKDYRGPRIIAMEPVMHQYVQQSVFRYFMEYCHYSPLGLAVNLAHGDYNASEAVRASRDRVTATIDLSDASDYVRVEHVRMMTRRLPLLWSYLEALRTSSVRLGDEVYQITTFAPMGSALCPPMQSAFYACLAISVYLDQKAPGRLVTAGSVIKAIKALKLRCYNDDIIVKTEFANSVIEAFEKAGLKPNRAKCCIRGFFRESCGTDAWFGHDVTPLRPRHLPGSSDQSLSGHLETVSNLWSKKFFVASATLLQAIQEETLKDDRGRILYKVPVLDGFERVPGTVSLPGCPVLQQHEAAFWDKNLQRCLVRSFIERPINMKIDPLNRAVRDALSRKVVSEQPFSGYATGTQRIKRSTIYIPRSAHSCDPGALIESALVDLPYY